MRRITDDKNYVTIVAKVEMAELIERMTGDCAVELLRSSFLSL